MITMKMKAKIFSKKLKGISDGLSTLLLQQARGQFHVEFIDGMGLTMGDLHLFLCFFKEWYDRQSLDFFEITFLFDSSSEHIFSSYPLLCCAVENRRHTLA